jgi:Carboxypeptidase regulatory-like domain
MRISILAPSLLIVASAARAQHGAVVVAHVLDGPDGAPVPAVTVTILGADLRATTDSLGTVVIRGVPPGPFSIEARRIGFAPAVSQLRSAGQDSIDVLLVVRTVAQTLPRVYVLDSATALNLEEFDARRRNHIGGYFIDHAAIHAWESSRISELLEAKVPGIRPHADGPKTFVYSTRGNGSIRNPAPCQVEVFLDRVRLSDGDASLVPLMELAGIEYYPPGFVPVQYRVAAPLGSKTQAGSQCGVLLLWRRR